MRILLLGFERWGPYSTNPTERVATRLDGKRIQGAEIVGVTLPVNFSRLPRTLKKAISRYKPDAVVTMGLAFRNLDRISIESQARRRIRPHFPDNVGYYPYESQVPVDYDVLEGDRGPSVRRSTLPVTRIWKELLRQGVLANRSRRAGGHMCEQVLYLAPHYMEQLGLPGVTGHLHLPHTEPEAKDVGSHEWMPFKTVEKGVRIVLKEIVRAQRLR